MKGSSRLLGGASLHAGSSTIADEGDHIDGKEVKIRYLPVTLQAHRLEIGFDICDERPEWMRMLEALAGESTDGT